MAVWRPPDHVWHLHTCCRVHWVPQAVVCSVHHGCLEGKNWLCTRRSICRSHDERRGDRRCRDADEQQVSTAPSVVSCTSRCFSWLLVWRLWFSFYFLRQFAFVFLAVHCSRHQLNRQLCLFLFCFMASLFWETLCRSCRLKCVANVMLKNISILPSRDAVDAVYISSHNVVRGAVGVQQCCLVV